jgi:branched-chain amino acid transport system ATP-binding protein
LEKKKLEKAKKKMENKAPLLSVKELDVSYGMIRAVQGISFEIFPGEIIALIGSNGAGKTSTLRAISGLTPCKSGKIIFDSEEIQELPPHKIVKRGLYQAPEGRGIFTNLSVDENLDLGAWAMSERARTGEILENVFELFPRLKERRKQSAGTLSGGEQQMLAIGRAMMGNPKLLLLDEPSLGLAPQFIELIFEIVERINKEGKTILLVEQNARQALQIADRGIVLETGSISLTGPAENLLQSEAVKKAYLG